ncbi:MAG: undecaprenyl/decaprenyl-phosphate alpha-N-acetylglucosaminyl 1-phosphate transferase [Anaerolineae bacterium]|nr:MAG: undecaprenyl/decaprenyl-phosphate alpha-N-acetylglucosaminyl 1-phosphate transferase [Anaerolineae bacterium]
MRAFLVVFLIAMTVTLAGIPWVRRAAIAMGLVDLPSQRKAHRTPTPLLGGTAIFIGAIIGVLLIYGGNPQPTVIGVVLAASVVALTGLIDDYRPLPAWAKLGGQLLGFLILAYFGIRVRLPVPDFVNYAITLIWLLGITNAINFLDNMDGLSAGISAVSSSFILLLALINGQFLVGALAAGLLGACLGFLRYNFPPAQIFMGDVGSLFLGFLLAVLGIQLRFPANSNFVTWMVPVFILGLPIFDMVLVVTSRIRRGLSPNTPGKDHISHRLVRLGFSSREAVLILYLISGVLGMMALFITQATIPEGYIVAAVTAVFGVVAIWWLERRWKESENE